MKKFNARDGKGIELLRNRGILTGIVTSENTEIVTRRAEKLKVDFLFQGITDKIIALDELVRVTGHSKKEVAYIGDDINDLEIMSQVGISFAPSNAIKAVKSAATIICQSRGGDGCYREAVEMLLQAI